MEEIDTGLSVTLLLKQRLLFRLTMSTNRSGCWERLTLERTKDLGPRHIDSIQNKSSEQAKYYINSRFLAPFSK